MNLLRCLCSTKFRGTPRIAALFMSALVLLSLLSMPSAALAEEDEGEDLGRSKGLPEKRVLTEKAEDAVRSGLANLQRDRVLVGWGAYLFGEDGYVRALGYIREGGALKAFEFRLEDPTKECAGTKTDSWCVRFPSDSPDEWVNNKHREHTDYGTESISSIWIGAPPSQSVQEAVIAAFQSTTVVKKTDETKEQDPYELRSDAGRTGGPDYTADAIDAFRGFESFPRILVLALALLALALFFFLAVRRLNPERWKYLLGWFALTVVALLARLFFVGEHAVFHENHHGFHYLRAILEGQEETFGLPSSYIILMHPLTFFTGGGEEFVFAWNAVFSALTVPLLGHLVIRLTGNQVAGWSAAMMWAITPHAIRMAPTASYFNFVAFALIAAALATVFALKDAEERGWRSWPSVVLAIALLAISAQSRVLTLVFPLGVALLALGAGVLRTRKQRIALGVMGVGVVAILSHQVWRLYGVMAEFPPTGSDLVSPLNNFSRFSDFAMFDPSVVSPTLLLLTGVGVVALFRGSMAKPAMEARALLLGVLFFVGVAGSVAGVFISRIRFEIPPNALLTGLAGFGVAAVMVWVGKRNKAVSIGVGAILILSAYMPYSLLKREFQDPLEYTFLNEEVLPALNTEMASGSPMVLVVPKAVSPGVSESEVGSAWWAKKIPKLAAPASFAMVVRENNSSEEEGETDAGEQKVFVYIGLDCFWADIEPDEDIPPEHISYCEAPFVEGSPRIHPYCARALAGARWKRVVTRTITQEQAQGSCVNLKPDEEQVEIGLFVVDEADPAALALIGPDCEPEAADTPEEETTKPEGDPVLNDLFEEPRESESTEVPETGGTEESGDEKDTEEPAPSADAPATTDVEATAEDAPLVREEGAEENDTAVEGEESPSNP